MQNATSVPGIVTNFMPKVFTNSLSGLYVVDLHPTNATTANIKRMCFTFQFSGEGDSANGSGGSMVTLR